MRRLLLLLALLCPFSARATLLQRFEIEDLAKHAEVVAIARVADMVSVWDDGMIRTRIRLETERTIAGQASRELTIVQVGGTVDGMNATMGGAPELEKGDRVVVFLESRARGGMTVVGAFQGVFRIVTERETGMPLAVRAGARNASFVDFPHDDGARSVYLDELEARVREVRR